MEIAAIVAISASKRSDATSSQASPTMNGPLTRLSGLFTIREVAQNVLGHNLIERTISRLRDLGITTTIVVPEMPSVGQLSFLKTLITGDSHSAWQRAIARAIGQGAEHLLLLRSDVYTDLNYEDMIRSHIEQRAMLTSVYAADDPLDIALLDSRVLGTNECTPQIEAGAVIEDNRFFYQGYVNRLCGPEDFMRLAEDGLHGNCGLSPNGAEVEPGIWLGEGAKIDDSCVISGPCFVGAEVRVGTCCMLGDGTAIERGCAIDSGTAIEQSWVLPGTYVGVGLNVRHSIVSSRGIFHLGRNTEVSINDRRLIGPVRSRTWPSIGARFLTKLQLSTLPH